MTIDPPAVNELRIGPYKSVRLLGKGGMSEVYEVENTRLGSRHALKLFTYEKDDPEVRERFQTEGRLLARLNHPRIVKVTDFGTDEASGKPYFVMDLVLNAHGSFCPMSSPARSTKRRSESGMTTFGRGLRTSMRTASSTATSSSRTC